MKEKNRSVTWWVSSLPAGEVDLWEDGPAVAGPGLGSAGRTLRRLRARHASHLQRRGVHQEEEHSSSVLVPGLVARSDYPDPVTEVSHARLRSDPAEGGKGKSSELTAPSSRRAEFGSCQPASRNAGVDVSSIVWEGKERRDGPRMERCSWCRICWSQT